MQEVLPPGLMSSDDLDAYGLGRHVLIASSAGDPTLLLHGRWWDSVSATHTGQWHAAALVRTGTERFVVVSMHVPLSWHYDDSFSQALAAYRELLLLATREADRLYVGRDWNVPWDTALADDRRQELQALFHEFRLSLRAPTSWTHRFRPPQRDIPIFRVLDAWAVRDPLGHGVHAQLRPDRYDCSDHRPMALLLSGRAHEILCILGPLPSLKGWRSEAPEADILRRHLADALASTTSCLDFQATLARVAASLRPAARGPC